MELPSSNADYLRRLAAQSRHTEGFWYARDFATGVQALAQDTDNPLLALALEGQKATDHLQTGGASAQAELHERFDFSDWVTRSLRNSVADSTTRMQSGLAILASAGSTAPFIGFATDPD